MSIEEIKALERRFIEEVWHRGNLALVDELLAPDYVYHRGSGDDLRGAESYKQYVTVLRTAFPDIHFTIDDFVVEGDKVALRWTLRGTHKGEYAGLPPTGKQLTVWGISIDRIAGGKILETWERYDTLGTMQQLGVIPPIGQR